MPFSNRLAPPLKIIGPAPNRCSSAKRTGLGLQSSSGRPGPTPMRKDCRPALTLQPVFLTKPKVFKELQEDNNKYAGRKAPSNVEELTTKLLTTSSSVTVERLEHR